MFRPAVLISFCCVLFSVFAYAENTLHIGVLSKRGDDLARDRWNSTADYLNQHVQGYRFDIVPLDFDSLDDAVEAKQIDFVITNTLYYVELEYRFGVTRIATLKNLGLHSEVLSNFGGVIFVRNDSKITSVEQLSNKLFGAVEKSSFGGWVMARKELRDNGIEIDDFTKLEFLKTHDQVVYDVLNGKVDAGTVRTDTLERMAEEGLIQLSQIRILNQKQYPGFPYLVSTALYPEWPFASLSSVDPEATQQVLLALLNMPASSQAAEDAMIAGWSSPLDYSKVNALLQEFELGPFANLIEEIVVKQREVNLSDIWGPEEIILAVGLLMVLGGFIYRYYTHTKLLDVKLSIFNISLISFELMVILFLIFEIIFLDRLENTLSEATQQRHEMISTADELRHSSDDLTHFARAYVVTGKNEFKQRYQRILDIRNGVSPRPINYQNIYWDLAPNYRKKFHPDSEKRSLKSMINSLPFTDLEKDKLLQSEKNSNGLVNLEIKAFAEAELGNTAFATQLLFSDEYYVAKQDIMLPIDQMMTALEIRTQAEIEQISDQVSRQFNFLLGLGLIFILGNLLIYWLLRKKVNQPIAYLSNVIEEAQCGFMAESEKHFNNDEIGLMIEQYFKMQHTIQDSTDQIIELYNRTQESIEYAALIQNALIPDTDNFNRYFDDAFALWMPRDIVGGDIFLLEELRNEDEVLLMVIDCTGHGVAGAFVTMLVKALERQMVNTIQKSDGVVSPARLLSQFNRSIKHLLKQESTDSVSNAGFDGGVIYYDRNKGIIRYAGANLSLYRTNGNSINVI